MQTNLFNASGAGAANAGANSQAIASQNSATSDMFTKLLVAQIKNQDPLAPTDPSQFVNQLTQLSQTESLQNMATLTSNNASVLQSLQVLALGAQVGSDLMVNTDRVQLDRATVSGSIALGASSSKTTLVLTGADGQKHNMSLGSLSAGSVPFSLDPGALGLPPGSYSMAVETSSAERPSVDIAGTLGSVRLSSSGGIVLQVANVGEVTPAAVTAFNGKSGASAATL
ncbi:MAG: flagellar hook capping FlgD N-terminal domain-containing protein [Pseudomonadota bacterium]